MQECNFYFQSYKTNSALILEIFNLEDTRLFPDFLIINRLVIITIIIILFLI